VLNVNKDSTRELLIEDITQHYLIFGQLTRVSTALGQWRTGEEPSSQLWPCGPGAPETTVQ